MDAATGDIVWRFAATGGGYYWNGATIISSAIVFTDVDGNIVSLDKYSGALLDSADCSLLYAVDGGNSLMRSSIAYSSELDMIFWTWEAGYCLALGFDSSNGTFDTSVIWKTMIGPSCSTPAVFGSRIYVGDGISYSTDGKHFHCLDALTGEEIWSFTTEGGVQSSPVISTYYHEETGRSYIYFTVNSDKGTLYCINDLGETVWSYTPSTDDGTYTLQGATPYNGWLYYGNDRGKLFAIGPA
jgi:outer membrane protein assembly factor BamB